MKVTTDDILDALRQALEKPSDANGSSVVELAARSGISEDRVRKSLKTLAAQNRLEVGRAYRPDISGRPMLIPTYRIKP